MKRIDLQLGLNVFKRDKDVPAPHKPMDIVDHIQVNLCRLRFLLIFSSSL